MSAILKNGLTPGSENPTFVFTLIQNGATGSGMCNAPGLQEEWVGGQEQRAQMPSEGHFTPNRKC